MKTRPWNCECCELKKLIGHVGVDSGTLILIDPCYIKYIKDLHNDKKWSSFCDNVLFPMHKSNEEFTDINSGIVFSNTIGDGNFPVYAHYDEDGAIKKLEVDFTFE